MAENIHIKNISGKVGSYAISTVDLSSFTGEVLAHSVQKPRKGRNVKEVVHKIFAECATATVDPFWAEKFTNASYGKFPPKFNYNDGMLNYRKGAKSKILEIPMNPYEAAVLCMEFFRTNGGIFSELDQQYSAQLQDKRSQELLSQKPLEWADLNKKMQECLLSYYVMSMKEVMKLRDSEIEQLRQTLHLGIKNKYFGKNNIHVENNRIQTVDGLLWNNNDRRFFINPELKPLSTRSYSRKKDLAAAATTTIYKDMTPQFVNKWCKYIDLLHRKNDIRMRAQGRIRIVHQSVGTARRVTLVTSDTSTLSPGTPGSGTPVSPRTVNTDDTTEVEDIENSDD